MWRRMRLAKIKTQAKLAEKTKLNTATISNIMKGKTVFNDDHIAALKPVLGGSTEEWEQYKRKGEDTQFVDDETLKKAFLAGTLLDLKVKVRTKGGVELEVPALYDPRDSDAAAKFVSNLINKMKEEGLDFEAF